MKKPDYKDYKTFEEYGAAIREYKKYHEDLKRKEYEHKIEANKVLATAIVESKYPTVIEMINNSGLDYSVIVDYKFKPYFRVYRLVGPVLQTRAIDPFIELRVSEDGVIGNVGPDDTSFPMSEEKLADMIAGLSGFSSPKN